MCKICCFIGHGDYWYDSDVRVSLYEIAEKLILFHDVKTFWVGKYGDFDRIVREMLRELKAKYRDIKIEIIVPYLTKDLEMFYQDFSKSYDGILLADVPEKTPHKLKIIKCNEYMVNNSMFMICFVKYSWGGAAKIFEYAKRKKHIQVFNIAK